MTALVVCVVAGDFRASGCAENSDLVMLWKLRSEKL
jgi:hypothetical protein